MDLSRHVISPGKTLEFSVGQMIMQVEISCTYEQSQIIEGGTQHRSNHCSKLWLPKKKKTKNKIETDYRSILNY